MDDAYTWTGFYQKLADRLLPFREDRPGLIARLQETYDTIGMKLPRLDSTLTPQDIDPFTVLGIFNKGITDANRRKIIAGLASTFDIGAAQPMDFSGIPVLNNLNATFYAFSNDSRRGPHDIDNLWEVFARALVYADDSDNAAAREAFCAAYDACRGQYSLGWKLTMGLYWVRPYAFLNLDSRNRWYLEDPANAGTPVADAVNDMDARAPKAYPDAATYLALCDMVREELGKGGHPYRTFPELSNKAWVVSQQVNDQKKAEEQDQKKEQEGESALGDTATRPVHYWLYAPGAGASMWDDFYAHQVMGLGWSALGDPSAYTSKEDIRLKLQEVDDNGTSQKNSAHAIWQFVHDVMPGDVVFAKRGRKEILGRGVVAGDFQYDGDAGRYPNLRAVHWTHKGSWTTDEMFAMKTLTDVTDYPDFVSKVSAFFEDEEEDTNEDVPAAPTPLEPYGREDFLSEVFMDEGRYNTLVGLLRAKRNVILEGAPGIGKTFAAKRLAYSMMGVKDPERVMMVQFHQSYSYEDFIEGFRPSQAGFKLEKGSFYSFCKAAADDADNDYFFVIDEINRGNLSKIFGELFMLIEADKRGPRNKLQLLYSHELFYVPANVYLIGMMNTADRSLAMLDFALRRRFAFFDLVPGFGTEGFRRYQEGLANPTFDQLVACVVRLNTAIANDASLGEGFCVGHSYLCSLTPGKATTERLSAIVEYELVPLLREYWYDDAAKADLWVGELRGSLK